MERMKALYLCDPEKNIGCKKTRCFMNPLVETPSCCCTTDPQYAVRDSSGNPITCRDDAEYFLPCVPYRYVAQIELNFLLIKITLAVSLVSLILTILG